MTIKQYIISFAAAALTAVLLTGCSGDSASDISPDPTPSTGKSEIKVNADIRQMMEGTRLTKIDNIQSEDLKIDAYYHGTETKYLDGVKLHYTGSTPAWQFWDGSAQLHYYWPFDGSTVAGSSTVASTLDFVGYCPFSAPGYITGSSFDHASGASFTCDMSSYMTLASQDGLKEYLIAVLNEQTLATQTTAGGALPMVFKHPFALIKFVIAEGSGTHVKINSISINNLYTSATCTYNGSTMSWGSYDDETKAAMSQTGLNLKYGTATTETTPFMVIPKNYGTMTLTVNGTWDDWSNVTKDISTDISIDWQPDYIYTYTLTVTKYALTVDIQKYTEQW